MFYVYILKSSSNGRLYIGYTNDLRRRFVEHQKGQSVYTKHRGPWQLAYYEAYACENDARKREIKLKQFKGAYAQLKKRIEHSLAGNK